MIEKKAFQTGMHALGAAFNREITTDVLRVFDVTLSPKLDDDQWQRAVRLTIERETYFPPPVTLLKYGLVERPASVTATEAFDRILNDYFSGDHASPRVIAERYGVAARAAFVAAGGVIAFENCGSEQSAQWVRKNFVAAWTEMVEANPQAALPGPGNQLPTELEASGTLDALAKRMP